MTRSLGCALALALMVVAGCARGEDAVGPQAVAARVGQLLYGDNLIADPEVNERAGRYIAAVDRDGVPPDIVLPEFHAWLDEWVRRNPDRAARARMLARAMAPGGPDAR